MLKDSTSAWLSAGLTAFAALLAPALQPAPARACGGLFCNGAQPVNQAAERILFVQNGDGTVTAVIEIQYEGPSEKFSWVLPVPGEPEVAVSSTTAFDRLQAQTNPQYMRQTTPSNCGGGLSRGTSNSAPQAGGDSAADGPGVSVVAMGTVGPFNYQVISVDPELPEPADAAVMWLEKEGYDVTSLGPEVLGPYLANGLNLIAFRLTKSSMSGSIRPIVITYESERPFIPIRPTAVAANDDMGVMVFVGASKRAIPDNYKALELNEARIDWFNPMNTYNDVVSEAADEAGGQGFVTEYADKSSTIKDVIVQTFERDQWEQVAIAQPANVGILLNEFRARFPGWDGLRDAVTRAVQLPDGVSVDDFLNCTSCYVDDQGFSGDVAALRKALYEQVIKPMFDTEALLQSQAYVTRLYTTMSAREMNLDPSFDFNAGLGDVSNVHTAQMTLGCDDSWKLVLPQGDVVYGETVGAWPGDDMSEQPAARKVMQLSSSGKGHVVTDNAQRITQLLKQTPSGNPARFDSGDDGGCHVAQPGAEGGHPRAALWLLLFALVSRVRRRR